MSKSKIHLRVNWKHTVSVFDAIDSIVKAVTCDNLMIAHRKFMHFVNDSSASQINSLAFNIYISSIRHRSCSIKQYCAASSSGYVWKNRATNISNSVPHWLRHMNSGHRYIACFCIWDSGTFPLSFSLILEHSIYFALSISFHFVLYTHRTAARLEIKYKLQELSSKRTGTKMICSCNFTVLV